MASKRKSLCIDEKVSLIRAIEAGEKISDVGKRLGFSRSTVSTIWKNKEKILQAENRKSSRKLKKPIYEDLDQAMLSWYHRQRQNNMPISGPIVKAKAKNIAEELGLAAFKASEGWLGKFKQRHHIDYGRREMERKEEEQEKRIGQEEGEATINVEAQNVDKNVNDDWINKVWPKLQENYAPNDIFNAEEVENFFKLTPDKTLKEGEKCVEGKLSKEHITVLVATNMDGTEKRKLVGAGNLIGKQMPVTYKANKTAWMTSQLFEEELRRWDAELKARKILLLVDNCSTHSLISNFQNIELAFLPQNTPSVLQPLDQNVIKGLKGHYRSKFMELVESEGKASINMLQAVNFLSKNWEEVTKTTTKYSFHHSGLSTSSASEEVKEEDEEVETGPEFESEDDLPLTEVQEVNMPQYFTGNLQTNIEVDESLATSALLADEETPDPLRKTDEQLGQQQGDKEDETNDAEPPPSIKQALDAAKLLEKYFLYNPVDVIVSQDMNKIHMKIQSKYWSTKKQIRTD